MPVRVLVVDDSSFFRRRVKEMLEEDARLTVVGLATDGSDAIKKTRELKPDVITMDVEMPVMDGITAVRRIMAIQPTPILMFSSLTQAGAQSTFDALDAGAIDYLPKNFEDISKKHDEVARILRSRVWGIGVRGLPNKKPKTDCVLTSKLPVRVPNEVTPKRLATIDLHKINDLALIAIGSSTGGPVAVQQILQTLPETFPTPILIAQHMPQSFTAAFADRLDKLCKISVREAIDGDVLKPGLALIAPGGKQLHVKRQGQSLITRVVDATPNQTYKPCIDITFSSIANEIQGKCLGLILTGMGADGREGARELKSKGSIIWAQDEASSIIYGMPMAVTKAGITDRELSLDDIASALIKVA